MHLVYKLRGALQRRKANRKAYGLAAGFPIDCSSCKQSAGGRSPRDALSSLVDVEHGVHGNWRLYVCTSGQYTAKEVKG